MPKGIINPFKPIQVKEHNSQQSFPASGPGQCQGKPVIEQHPVGYICKGIMICLINKLLLHFTFLSNITKNQYCPNNRTSPLING